MDASRRGEWMFSNTATNLDVDVDGTVGRRLKRMPPPDQGCAMDASLRGEAGLRLHVRLCVKDPDGPVRKPMWMDPEATAGCRDGPAATA